MQNTHENGKKLHDKYMAGFQELRPCRSVEVEGLIKLVNIYRSQS